MGGRNRHGVQCDGGALEHGKERMADYEKVTITHICNEQHTAEIKHSITAAASSSTKQIAAARPRQASSREDNSNTKEKQMQQQQRQGSFLTPITVRALVRSRDARAARRTGCVSDISKRTEPNLLLQCPLLRVNASVFLLHSI